MKQLTIALFVAATALCACGKCEKIYTPEELGWYLEWTRSGWSEVKNETDETVTLITAYPYLSVSFPERTVTSEIRPGDAARLDRGDFMPGVSIDECTTATIKLGDGSEIVCVRAGEDPWSKRFFENCEERYDYEIVELDKKKIKHGLTIRTFHIDNRLIELWKVGK